MKLTDTQAKTLVEVLNAQNGVARMEAEPYKAKLAEVGQFMNVGEDKKPSGGITKEVYAANKENKELVEAAKLHVEKAKARADKAVAKATAEPKSKQRTPEQEIETAQAILAYFNAVTGKERISKEVDGKSVNDPEGFRHVANKSRKYVDHKAGGLLNTAAEGKTAPLARFTGKDSVVPAELREALVTAAKGHRKHVKEQAKSKDTPEPGI